MIRVTAHRADDGLSLTIPNEVAARAHIEDGTAFDLFEDARGGLHLAQETPETARLLRALDRLMDKYDAALRAMTDD